MKGEEICLLYTVIFQDYREFNILYFVVAVYQPVKLDTPTILEADRMYFE